MPTGLTTRTLTVDPSSWTAVVAPAPCLVATLYNADAVNACKRRTDSADAGTERTIPADAEFLIRARGFMWNTGETICYLQSVAGTGPVKVDFVQ